MENRPLTFSRIMLSSIRFLNLATSKVGYMGLDEVLFGDGLVEKILDGSIQVADIVGFHDFFRKLGEKRSGNTMKS